MRVWIRGPRVSLLAFALAAPAFAQGQPSPLGWSGWARCQVNIQGPGYADQQTHTWTMTAAAPAVEGAFRVYPATWSVVGGGSLQRSQGTQTLMAQWATNVPAMSAPLAVFVRASDGQMFIQARHAQLRGAGAIQGYQQVTIDGKPQPPGQIASEAFEWTFPVIAVSSPGTRVTGSSTVPVSGSAGLMQPAGSQVTAACTWQFGQGGAAPGPPPVVNAQSIPTAPPAGNTPGTSVSSPPVASAPSAPVTTTGPRSTPNTSTPTASASQPPTTVTASPTSPSNSSSTIRPPGGFTAVTGDANVLTAATAKDPSNFTARQTADGTVLLSWDAVAGAGSYLLGGPGTNVGITVTTTSQTVTGIPAGDQAWTVATIYNPGGILTTADKWPRATTKVVNTSGRYRVVVNGFRVNHPTFDDRVFGNGDEGYGTAAVSVIDRRNDSVLQPRTVIQTDTYGDVSRNPERVQAGSFSPTGGLWSGDLVPSGADPRTTTAPSSTRRFPWLVWEGTLRDGVEAVVINPVLWELDGQSKYYTEWADANSFLRSQAPRVAAQTAAIKDRAARADLTPFRGPLVFHCTGATTVSPECDPGNDRPIGVNSDACVGDILANTSLISWCDITVVVTREGIEKALASTSQIGGMPAGIIVVPLIEPSGVDAIKGGLDGNYELYVRVERVP